MAAVRRLDLAEFNRQFDELKSRNEANERRFREKSQSIEDIEAAIARLCRSGAGAPASSPQSLTELLEACQRDIRTVESHDSTINGYQTESAKIRAELNNFFYMIIDLIFGRPREKKIEELKTKIRNEEQVRETAAKNLAGRKPQLDSAKQELATENSALKQQSMQQLIAYLFEHSTLLWRAWEKITPTDDWQRAPKAEGWVRVGQAIFEGIAKPHFAPLVGGGQSLVIAANSADYSKALSLMQSVLLRIALMYPHQSLFTLIDPSGYGRAFPMRQYLTRVTDLSEDLYQDLQGVESRIRHVVQNVLGFTSNFHELPDTTLASEPFEFIFVAGFPRGFDRRSIEVLFNAGASGPPAGRYLVLLHNTDEPLPRDMDWTQLPNAHFVNLSADDQQEMEFDDAPAGDKQRDLLLVLEQSKPQEHGIGWESVIDLPPDQWWREESSERIRTPAGNSDGSLKVWFGVNEEGRPCAHGMLAAMTGQGKSNLYHALILGLATRYPPDELQLYLIDGKDGVEFQIYKDLPHAAVVSLNSLPELSRSVLTELLDEKERRNELFSRHNVNSFTAYRRAGSPAGKLPRIMLLIDEYQELFEGDDEGFASQQILQLAQQGRSVGIHMLLGSQQIDIPNMLNQSAIFGNIHLRMAMKLDDQQTHTVFGPAARDLIKQCDVPGKIVINDQTGVDGGNVFGKVAKMPDDFDFSRQRIEALQQRAAQQLDPAALPHTVVFNGGAQPRLHENTQLRGAAAKKLSENATALAETARADVSNGGFGKVGWIAEDRPIGGWMGQEFNVRGHAMIALRRGISQHIAVAGGGGAHRYGVLAGIIASATILHTRNDIAFRIIDRSVQTLPEGTILETLTDQFLKPRGFEATYTRDSRETESILTELTEELEKRIQSDNPSGEKAILVVLTEVDRIPEIRRPANDFDDDLSDALEALNRLLAEGSQYGIHVMLAAGGRRLLNLAIDLRRQLNNISHRIGFQMSEDDSFELFTSRAASQLQDAGPKPISGLYFNLESAGGGTRFKPYDATELIDDLDQLQSIV